jgi:dienelactone hydrolase
LLVGAVAVATIGGWFAMRSSRVRWVHDKALPEIDALVDAGRVQAALGLVRRSRVLLPADLELQRLEDQLSARVSVRTTPAGSRASVRGYAEDQAAWEVLGSTPLDGVAVPETFLHWRLEKEGYQTAERTGPPRDEQVSLLRADEHPGMVWVTGAPNWLTTGPPAPFGDYLLDKHEVTNEAYRAFLESGGYRAPRYWTEPFARSGKPLSFDEAVAEFRDRTGRPGPSTWELGSYPEGQGDYPVRGVSWYEAAAYCRSVGKTLPTYHHWLNAAGLAALADLVTAVSNFSGEGPAPVGRYKGVGPYGTYDMAGNVKEWCWNEAQGNRYALGGAWDEPTYMYVGTKDARSPWTRGDNLGFRCARYEEPLPAPLTGPVAQTRPRDYATEKPVSDELFETIRGFYSYDPRELNARVESVDDSPKHWRKERVSFDAAYGQERVIANLYLPRNAAPPFQAVVYFPGAGAQYRDSIEKGDFVLVEFLVRSGRAVLCPMYKGTYERRSPAGPQGEKAWRDVNIQWAKDLARSVDYLESREDVDDDRLAYFGFSLGAWFGLVNTAVETRFSASVLLAGGLPLWSAPRETDPVNFVSRVRTPTLVINGREDLLFQVETSVRPMYERLGVSEPQKKLVIIDAGHIPPRLSVIRETLDWLDRHLGPAGVE